MIFCDLNISREWLVLIKWSLITERRLWEGLVLISRLAVIRVAIKGSGYHTIALSHSPWPGHGDYRDYLQSRVSWFRSPNPPDHYRAIGLAYRASEQRHVSLMTWRMLQSILAAKSINEWAMLQMCMIMPWMKQNVIELEISPPIWYLILIKICGCVGTAHVLFIKPCRLIKAAKVDIERG